MTYKEDPNLFKADSLKVWVDDVREPPDNTWVWSNSVQETMLIMSGTWKGHISYLSLDHDMGDQAKFGGDCIELVKFMCEKDRWPIKGIQVHSMNPVGRTNMLQMIDRYGPFGYGTGVSRGTW